MSACWSAVSCCGSVTNNQDARRGERRRLVGGAACRFLPRTGSGGPGKDRKSTRLNSSHVSISYAVFCLKKKNPTSIERLTKTKSKIGRVRIPTVET